MIRYLPYISDAGGGGMPGGLLFFSGIWELPGETVGNDPETERTDFLSYLSGQANEPFDGYTLGDYSSITITRNGSTCTVKQLATIENDDFTDVVEIDGTVSISNYTGAQRFNTSTTSDRWLDVFIDAGYYFGGPSGVPIDRKRVQFTFSTNIVAFGFYGTDFGDFINARSILLDLTDEDDVVTTHTVTNNAEHEGGNLIFWGFVDTTGLTYKKAVVYADPDGGESDGAEGLGFDDIVFCTSAYLA